MTRWIGILVGLAKLPISALVVVSVAAGYILFAERLELPMLLPLAGVFLVACGAAALNQVQDARFDARTERTRHRPIPAGRIEPRWALFIALAWILTGFNVLANVEAHTGKVLALTALALLWYNGLYTYLKRVTAFAVIPGALVGALPPVIGWAAAGGVATDGTILELAFFLFLWQIPHFWLLAVMHAADFERAGLPAVTRLFNEAQLARITFAWLAATAAAGLLVGVLAPARFPWNVGLLAASIWLVASGWRLLAPERAGAWRQGAFLRINLYALAVLLLLTADAAT